MTAETELAIGAGACLVTLVATPLAARTAKRLQLVDHPGPLKPQSQATPYLGGAAVALGVAVGAAAYRPLTLLPLAVALGVGTADDARPLPPMVRLIAEVLAGVVLALLITTRISSPFGFVLVAIATVVLINGFNLIDGLDALCGAVTFVSAVGFALIVSGHGAYVAVALAGATAAFVVFNRPPARIYLGDGGAYLIGTAVAALLALSWGRAEPLHTGVAALPLVFLPVAELGFAIVRRVRSGASLLVGDRDHPYDQLVRRGWSKERTVLSYVSVGVILLGVALIASTLSTSWAIAMTGASALLLILLGASAGFMSPNASSTDEGMASR